MNKNPIHKKRQSYLKVKLWAFTCDACGVTRTGSKYHWFKSRKEAKDALAAHRGKTRNKYSTDICVALFD